VTVLLATCGGDGLSASEYRTRLDAACEKVATANARIPQRVRNENLGIGQAEEIGRPNGEEFAGTVVNRNRKVHHFREPKSASCGCARAGVAGETWPVGGMRVLVAGPAGAACG
jgi:hypothetical protein